MPPPVRMSETGRFNVLRLRYRAHWDAYQAISQANAALALEGKRPPKEQVAAEQKASAELERAKDALLAAISRLDK